MKFFKYFYAFIGIMICCLPLAFMPFVKSDAEIEKKELTELPNFVEDGSFNIHFSEQFESWFNDRLPFRAAILSFANLLQSECLKVPSSNVIVGKDGWLFYETESADYMDTNALTDDQINAIGITLSLIEESINEKGGNFTFVAMPNKSSVYEEYMPDHYLRSTENNLTRLLQKLEELDITYVDMLKVMRDNKEKGVYHQRDSHWNYQGALIGYNAIMDSLQVKHKTYDDAKYTIEKNWRGDLDKLLYPIGGCMDEQYIYDIPFTNFRFEGARGDAKEQLAIFMSDKEQGDDVIKAINSNNAGSKRLFMARDSFGRAILPYFIDNYGETTFRRTDNPDIVSIGKNTDMVYEIVERNLHRIIATAPFVYAPKRDIDTQNMQLAGGVLESKYAEEGYGTRIYGSLDENIQLKNNRIYIELKNKNDIIIYEAFPILESKFLETYGTKGYSMYINPKDGLKGEYDMKVIIGDQYYTAGSIILT